MHLTRFITISRKVIIEMKCQTVQLTPEDARCMISMIVGVIRVAKIDGPQSKNFNPYLYEIKEIINDWSQMKASAQKNHPDDYDKVHGI